MAPKPSPAPGNPAGGPPAPPLEPHAVDVLLTRDPARAAAILIAMRPALRAAQIRAHADLVGVPVERIAQEWAALIAECGPLVTPTPPDPDAPPHCTSVYDPEMLADLLAIHPRFAYELIGRLTERQRVTQALAQATWLTAYGLPTTLDEVLASWEASVTHAAA